MPKEIEAIICSNPRCRKKIEEPILLKDSSIKPPKQYYACPHCFIKLDADAENDEDITQETVPNSPVPPSLEKILDVISNQSQKEKENKEKTEELPVKLSKKEEKGSSGCPHNFGYLANRPKNAPIPQECLICPKIVDCMLKLAAS